MKSRISYLKGLLNPIRFLALIAGLFFISETSFGQEMVVSSYYNASSPSDEWSELLVVQDNLNIGSWTFRDHDVTQTAPQPSITFIDGLPLWSNLRTGTIIVIWHRTVSSTGVTRIPDVDPSDGYIELSAQNTSYFSGGSFGSTLDIAAGGDFVELSNASGVHVHGLGHQTIVGGAYTAAPIPKLNHREAITSDQVVMVYPGTGLANYGSLVPQNGLVHTRRSGLAADFTFGLPNFITTTPPAAQSNREFWRSLRQPSWPAPGASFSIDANNTTVTLNWAAVPDPNSTDNTVGYLILRNTANDFTDPTDGITYAPGDMIGTAEVVTNVTGSTSTSYNDIITVPCVDGLFYRVYPFRYGTDNINGNNYHLARGRAYNVTQFGNINAIVPAITDPTLAASDITVFCENTPPASISLSADGSGPTLEWFTGSCGGTLVGAGNPLTISPPTTTTTYYARWNSVNSCYSSCMDVTVSVDPANNASVSIVAVPSNTVCAGTQVTLTATPVSSGSPGYQWYLNGIPVGANQPTYTFTPAASDQVYVEMTSVEICSDLATSNIIPFTVNAVPVMSAVGNNPAFCGQNGSIAFNFTNVPDGTYNIVYATGTFTGVVVTSGLASVPAPAGFYENLNITVSGCSSVDDVDITLNPGAQPTLAAAGNNPVDCISNGSIDFNFANVPDGIYNIVYTTGTFTGVVVISGVASVPAPAGFYENLNITVTGCTSTEDVDITLTAPAQPTLDALGNNPVDCISDGSIDFFFTNVPDGTYNIAYATGTFTGVVVALGFASVPAPTGFYENLNITVTGCTSTENVDITVSAPNQPTLAATGTDPVDCTIDGSIDFLFSNIPDGTYNIDYATGTFTGVVVTSGQASVTAPAGFYENLNITVAGCTSTEDVDITLTAPSQPTLAAAGNNPVDCTSNGSIDFDFTNVPDGSYNIVYATGTFTGVVVTSGVASVSAPAGFYENLNITNTGCTSAEDVDITLTAPALPTLAATGNNPVDCTGDGSIVFGFTNVPDGTYDLVYATGIFTGVVVASGVASIPAPAGFYENLNITVTGCTSTEDVDITLTAPSQPALTAAGNNPVDCISNGSIDFNFANVPDGTYDIEYANGTFTGVVVNSGVASVPAPTGFYENLIITVTGCTSTEDVDITLTVPNQPAIAATGNNPVDCINDGSIDFNFVNVPDGTYDIVYATGTFTGVVVTTGVASVPAPTGFYENLNITVSGCTSINDIDITLNAPNQPIIAATGINPVDCISDGSIDFFFTNVPDGTYDIAYATGTFTGVVITSGQASVSAPVSFYENLNITSAGCNSAEDLDITINSLIAPVIESVTFPNTICSNSNDAISIIASGNTSVLEYSFDNGTTWQANSQFNLTTGGNYQVIVRDGLQCETNWPSAINITEVTGPEASITLNSNSASVCSGEPVIFDATPVNEGVTPSYSWFVNGILQPGNDIQFVYVPTDGDLVEIEMNSSELCATNNPAKADETVVLSPCGFMLAMPNVFTPGNNLVNDVFRPVMGDILPTKYLFQVFNRWGEIVFETSNPDLGWDGTNRGNPSPKGVYVYKLEFEVPEYITNSIESPKRGAVMLLR